MRSRFSRMRCLPLCLVACTATSTSTTVPCTPTANAPTYTELFTTYFAPDTPGHCATAGCHADPDHDTWLCGTTKTTCYAGMVGVGLIDPTDLAHSMIADPDRSPLAWI